MKNIKCGFCLGLAILAVCVVGAFVLTQIDVNIPGTKVAGIFYDSNPWAQ